MHFTPQQRAAWYAQTKESPFNRWLRGRTTRSDGTLDLDRLHAVAAEYGIDAGRYAHLNPGQQRMNIGNRLRHVVPARIIEAGSVPVPQSAVVPPAAPVPNGTGTVDDMPTHLYRKSLIELLRQQAEAIDELQRRGVARTANAPLGDYAEHLFTKAFGWTLTANSKSGHDAIDAAGLRFQIKARRLRQGVAGERQLGIFRNLPEDRFDMLGAILFDRDFSVRKAALIPHTIVLENARHVTHVNGWRFILEDRVWALNGVRDVTERLRLVANRIDQP